MATERSPLTSQNTASRGSLERPDNKLDSHSSALAAIEEPTTRLRWYQRQPPRVLPEQEPRSLHTLLAEYNGLPEVRLCEINHAAPEQFAL